MTHEKEQVGPMLDGIALGPGLTQEQAEAIFDKGKDAAIFALMQYAAMVAKLSNQSPVHLSTPSGMIPVYQKPSPAKRGRKKPGRKAGHEGARRPIPNRVDRRQTHRAEQCPHCQGPLKRGRQTRKRYTEDIPDSAQSEVTEHTIHRDWCPRCKKMVEPVVPDALPNATIGHRTLAMTAWLHYCQGNTISQVLDVFNYHFEMKLSEGGLVQMWSRLAKVLYPWYEQIRSQGLHSAVLHGDETGWRVQGKTWWLWCFGNPDLTFYRIDQSRSSAVLQEFFAEHFNGTLVTDFWGAYNAVACDDRQMCLAHLLRELKTVEQYKKTDKDWPEFAKRLRRLLRDAIRLARRRDQLKAESYQSRRDRIHQRMKKLIEQPWANKEVCRLFKRLRRHQGDLFTFLDKPEVPFDNNHAERSIRPAVILRKNSYGNRSIKGAECQAILMSIMRTLKQRGYQPSQTIAEALREYMNTGKLPPLPTKSTTDG